MGGFWVVLLVPMLGFPPRPDPAQAEDAPRAGVVGALPIVGWHHDTRRRAVLGFCWDSDDHRYRRTRQRVDQVTETRPPYRWL